MDERATGLILRTRPLTESSLIVSWLTSEAGRLSTVAKGARRPKSPFLGKLDLFYLADFSYQPSRRSELHTLREVKVREHHAALRRELGYLQQAAYFVQLLEQTTETGTPLPGMFRLLSGALQLLPVTPPRALTVFAFETKLLLELGLQPEWRDTGVSAGTGEVLQRLSAGEWTMLPQLRLSAEQTEEMQRFLQSFMIYHLGRLPKGRTAALLVGSWTNVASKNSSASPFS